MSTPKPPIPTKKDVTLALLQGPSVFVHLDPRKPGVVVPPWFKQQPQLVLQIGLNMPVPIPDLDVSDEGITCTLSFNRSPHWCKLPWSAIYALVGEDGRAMLWPDDVPPEVAAQLERAAKKPRLAAVDSSEDGKTKARPSRAKKKPAAKPAPEPLQVAPSPEPAAEEAPEAAPAPPAPRPAPSTSPALKRPGKKRELPPYLRVVK